MSFSKTLGIVSMVLLTTLFSCKTTNVQFEYLGPAAINISTNIKNIVVVDHSAPKDQIIDIIEGGLTGEGIGQDVEAVLNLIDGFKTIGQQSNRYSISREPKRHGKGKLLENIPEPMDLSLIKSIGQKHNADAVLAIDKFDSDFIVTTVKVDYSDDPDASAETKKQKAYEATGVASVFAYIRLYETSSGNILDEIKLKENFSWNVYGETADAAIKALIMKQAAVNDVSRRSGVTYGRRIAPNIIPVTRAMYKKPKDHETFARGVRKAQVGDWQGAITDWKLAESHASDIKVRARAAYNTAIAFEVLGDLKSAQKWAQKAHIEHGEKKAKSYYEQLTNRVIQEEQLNEQMGSTNSGD
ncbi:MAG: hypothetical protein KDC92_10190 [Bacteroidetes bacterium]|nr:hypothetical protein [Bacteroidota bacterium]